MSSTLSVEESFAEKSFPVSTVKTQVSSNFKITIVNRNFYMFESTAPSLDLQMRGARTFGSEFICLFPMKSKHRRYSLWCLFLGEQAWEKPFPTRKRSIRFSCFAWQRAATCCCCLHLLDSVERRAERFVQLKMWWKMSRSRVSLLINEIPLNRPEFGHIWERLGG